MTKLTPRLGCHPWCQDWATPLLHQTSIGTNPQKTSHNKIQKAQDLFIPFNKLNKDLNILTNLLKENNVNEIKDMLTKLVSNYKSETKIVDHLFLQQSNFENKKI